MSKKLIVASALVLVSAMANAVTVNATYLNKTMSEVKQHIGRNANPTLYIDKRACGEPSPNAMACSPYIISVGTQFLQQQERTYGNYSAKMVIAHEAGHSIQFTRNSFPSNPYAELQADCVGGSFIKYAETSLKYTPFLVNAVASARAAADYAAHGTPTQREYYTRWGYANGLPKCLSSLPRV